MVLFHPCQIYIYSPFEDRVPGVCHIGIPNPQMWCSNLANMNGSRTMTQWVITTRRHSILWLGILCAEITSCGTPNYWEAIHLIILSISSLHMNACRWKNDNGWWHIIFCATYIHTDVTFKTVRLYIYIYIYIYIYLYIYRILYATKRIIRMQNATLIKSCPWFHYVNCILPHS